jgi:hypothetical protein
VCRVLSGVLAVATLTIRLREPCFRCSHCPRRLPEPEWAGIRARKIPKIAKIGICRFCDFCKLTRCYQVCPLLSGVLEVATFTIRLREPCFKCSHCPRRLPEPEWARFRARKIPIIATIADLPIPSFFHVNTGFP